MVTSALSTVFQIIVLIVGSKFGVSRISSGPYALIFASLLAYSRDIPTLYRFRILGFSFSDKSLIYLLGLQLLLSSWSSSLTAGMTGILAGSLYKSGFLRLHKWRFPHSIRRIGMAIYKPLLGSTRRPLPRVDNTTVDSIPNVNARTTTALNSPPLMDPHSEEAIATLMALGFDRNDVLQALRSSQNNLDM